MLLLSVVPRFKESISDSKGSGLVCSIIVKVESGSRKGVFYMIHDLSLNRFGVISEVRPHQLPHFFSSFFRPIVFEFRLFRLKHDIFDLLTLYNTAPSLSYKSNLEFFLTILGFDSTLFGLGEAYYIIWLFSIKNLLFRIFGMAPWSLYKYVLAFS